MPTVRDQILDDLVATIQGVTVANLYSTDMRIVDREIKHWEDVSRFPACYITGDVETLKRSDVINVINANWTVEILVYVKHSRLLSTEIEKLIGDVRKAIFVDRTRGGLATYTTINSITNISKWLKPIGIFIMELNIQYQYNKTTP